MFTGEVGRVDRQKYSCVGDEIVEKIELFEEVPR